ncbi:MAG: hypothetical protein HN625_07625 [Flavobacteriaceae bacterium]|jgi:hypothetical protein|nr:hypothetical protein [Flavobacteriaceae bacterium]
MTEIPVIYSFARSGGTLVNQLLGVHPKCLVLSEINPAASFKPIAEQAVEWLGLLEEKEVKEFSHIPYYQQIKFLNDRAIAQKKKLIIRDWVTVNFLSGSAGYDIIPSRQLEQNLYLERVGFQPSPLVITRKGTDVYKSIRNSFLDLAELEMNNFAESYLEYARAVAEFPIIHLEDLRSQPEVALGKILHRFNISCDDNDSLLQNFFTFKNCTGNVSLKNENKSAVAQEILPPEKLAPTQNSHPYIVEANGILGYE